MKHKNHFAKWILLAGGLLLGVVLTLPTSAFSHSSGKQALPKVDQSQYLGSAKCAACHKGHYESWKDSAHNKMIRPAIAEGPDKTIFADFSKPDPNRPFELKDVKWVIGQRWKQRFIGVVNGEEVVFPAQWSIQAKKWQSYTAKSDWWYPQHPDWRTRSNFKLCAGCHSTGSDPEKQNWVELNITCESCHGPGRKHSESLLKSDIVNPARLSTERSIEVCLSCHQAGKTNSEEYAWPVGYQPGRKLGDYWHGFEPEAGKQTPEFWANGTAHKNRVQGNTFTHSVMFKQGIQCSNCHDAHGSRYRSMTIKSAETNALCLACHGPGKFVGPSFQSVSDHTHHLPTSTGSQCINCHMPKTGENSVAGEARDHTFNFISPAVSADQTTPNSCNLCHTDKTSQWALEAARKWYPKLK